MSRNPVPPRMPPRSAPPKAPAPRTPQPPPTVDAPPPAASETPQPAKSPAPFLYGPGDEIVARASAYYRNTRYIMVVILLGMAGWFGYDGFKGWPDENQRIDQIQANISAAQRANDPDRVAELKKDRLSLKQKHDHTDLLIQKLLAFGLPVGAMLMLAWAMYRSRGEFRLKGDLLSAPGHPPISLGDIAAIDRQMWDRKGIAHLAYKSTAGPGTVTLDDFIYERDPIDEIYKRADAHLTAGASE